MVVASLLLISLVSNWSLRPLARASKEATAIGPADPTVRVSTSGLPAEILPLVGAVKGGLNRLAHAHAALRRTPLSVRSLRLQRAKHTGCINWPIIEREMEQMNRLARQLMDLARKESPTRLEEQVGFMPVGLPRIVREAVAMVLPLTEQAQRSVDVDAPDSVVVHGQSHDLRDVIRNLIENGLMHGCGAVRARLAAGAGMQRSVPTGGFGAATQCDEFGTSGIPTTAWGKCSPGFDGRPCAENLQPAI